MRLLVAVVLAALVVAGCSDDDDPPEVSDEVAGATSEEICDQFDDLLADVEAGSVSGQALAERVGALADAALEVDDQELFTALTDVSTGLVEGAPDQGGVAEVEAACGG